MPRIRFSSLALMIFAFGFLGGNAFGQSCFNCGWYYQSMDYQGQSSSVSDVVGDLDSPVYADRQEATDALIGEFTGWLREDSGPDINLHIGVDLIEMRFDSFHGMSREASFRIDYIIATLRDEVDRIIQERQRMRRLWERGTGHDGFDFGHDAFDTFDPFKDGSLDADFWQFN